MTQQPTIVILHGWSLEPELQDRWQPLIKLLQTAGYQAQYLSLPGFDKPLKSSWDLNDFRDYVLKQTTQYKQLVLLGHSFGGQLAVRVAASQPNNLQGLVLIGPAGIVDQNPLKKLKRTVFKTTAVVGKKILGSKQANSEKSSSVSVTQPLRALSKKLLYKLARETDYLQAPPVLKESMAKILKDEVLEDLPQIKLPTLIIWGDKDRYTPIKHSAIFATHLPHTQLKILEQEGHRPYYTQPETVCNHINYFIQNHVA